MALMRRDRRQAASYSHFPGPMSISARGWGSSALFVAAAVLAIDLHRSRRSQAVSVVIWSLPWGAEKKANVKIHNLSDKPIFGLALLILSHPPKELRDLVYVRAAMTNGIDGEFPAMDLPHAPDEYACTRWVEYTRPAKQFPGRSSARQYRDLSAATRVLP
jgi:hypothetical protein